MGERDIKREVPPSTLAWNGLFVTYIINKGKRQDFTGKLRQAGRPNQVTVTNPPTPPGQ